MRLSRHHSIAALAAIIWLAWGTAPALALSGVMRTRFFVVRYDRSDPFLAEIVASNAEKQLRRIARDLRYSLKDIERFPLNAYPNHHSFLDAGGLERGSTTVGTTRWGDESISVDASDVLISMEEVLAHEITHAIVFRLLGPHASSVPTWFNEGLAKYESRDWDPTDGDIVAKAAADNVLLPLSRLTSRFPEKRESLAYAESASAVRYLVSRFGKSAPRRILHKLNATGSFEDAMQSVTGLSVEQFENQWYSWTTKRHAGFRLTSIGTALISSLMAFLAIAAFLARQKQKREAAMRWESEDDEYDDYARP